MIDSEPHPLISVIVPVYNVEKYLDRCIESVCGQTYDNLQIILVDDGSTDSCGEKCEAFAKGDSRITVIHQKNAGLSAARNAGNKLVEGEYILYVDSDDYIGASHVENLLNVAKEHSASLVITGSTRVLEEKVSLYDWREINSFNSRVMTCEEAFEIAVIANPPKIFEEHAWGKLYSVDLLPYLEFPVGKLYEDRFVMYKIILLAKKVAYSDANDYYYLVNRSGSITNRKILQSTDTIVATKEMLEFVKENRPYLYELAESRYFSELIGMCTLSELIDEKKYAEQFFKEIVTVRKRVKKNKFVSRSTRLGYLLSYFGYTIFIKMCTHNQQRLDKNAV